MVVKVVRYIPYSQLFSGSTFNVENAVERKFNSLSSSEIHC